MRNLLLAISLGVLPTSLAAAEDVAEVAAKTNHGSYGMAGCGLGSLVFDGSSNGKGSQILAATTNGTFGSQTLGITSGTSNCTADGTIAANREQEAFVEVNLKSIERDAASGGGEYLAALGDLMGCEKNAQPALFSVAQDRYDAIFPANDAAAAQVLVALKTQARTNAKLVNSCARL
ncbi:MAG: DUF3015 family protein [Myxococcota bacterium]